MSPWHKYSNHSWSALFRHRRPVAAEGVGSPSQQTDQCLLRVGYRTVRLSGAKDAVVDAELHDALFPHDVLVEEEPMASSKSLMVDAMAANSTLSGAKPKMRVGPMWTETFSICVGKCPLVRLVQEHRDQQPVAVLSHNPEMQKSSDNSSSNINSSTNLVGQLQQNFVALRQYVNQEIIATFGVVINGFSLPEQHPCTSCGK